jgi:hypothetical protein
MSTTRIYRVIENADGSQKEAVYHLVRAQSAAQAIRHIVTPRFVAEVATADQLVELVGGGAKVQEATS